MSKHMLTMLLSTLLTTSLYAALPTKFVLNNDIIVGSKIQVLFADIKPHGATEKDEEDNFIAYCIIEDTYNKPGTNSKILKKGTFLEVVPGTFDKVYRTNEYDRRIQDLFAVVKSTRGGLQRLGCSINETTSDVEIYELNEQSLIYLKALGITPAK